MKKLVWFRRDFRLTDNPALTAAAGAGEIIPVFIWSPKEEGSWQPGSRSCAWLRQTLEVFEWPLVIRQGAALPVLKELVKESGADGLYFNRCYEPALLKRDQKIIDSLGIEVKTFNASLLVEPWEVETKQGKPYQVFTPFWKSALKHGPFIPKGKAKPTFPKRLPRSEKLDLPDEPLCWEIGEKGAHKQLRHFLKSGLANYDTLRDRPDMDGVSCLSPYLHFGEIGPRQIWAEAKKNLSFIRQLFWREFAHHLIYHFPMIPDHPLRANFAEFPWLEGGKELKAWKEGRTGYPIVDAGMRQLLKEGWMHNRVRLIVASFLTKDLLIPWQEGAKWFWEKLVDADLANNTLGWQWTAGCGADAAPFFRIFNPVTQSKKFDPDGAYIRKFVPELAHLPTKWIHAPWEIGEKISGYPQPIIEHNFARMRALKAFEKVKV